MGFDFSKYSGMSSGTYQPSKPQVAPEDEFLHNIYITASMREGEDLGTMQIRGFASNLKEINMIILKHKIVLVNEQDKRTICFSYRDGSVWNGTTRDERGNLRVCGRRSDERQKNPFCASCRSQYIIAGLLVNPNGSIIKDQKGREVYVFIRGARSRYSSVSDYVYGLCNKDFPTKLFGEDPAAVAFEKEVVNPMRVITKITVGSQKSAYGLQMVYAFEPITPVPDNVIQSLLDRANDILLPEFVKKIDWSKSESFRGSDEPTFGEGPVSTVNQTPAPEQTQSTTTVGSFDFGGSPSGFNFDNFNM